MMHARADLERNSRTAAERNRQKKKQRKKEMINNGYNVSYGRL